MPIAWMNVAKAHLKDQMHDYERSYEVSSGSARLRHPSSSNRLPNGNFLVSDDHNDRVVVINAVTDTIIWQYGITIIGWATRMPKR